MRGGGSLLAQNPVPFNFGPVGANVGTVGSAGNAAFSGYLSTGFYNVTSPTPGILELYGSGVSAGSISIQAPSSLTSSLTWTLPSGSPTAASLLTFSLPVSNVSTLTYTGLTSSGGIVLTPSTGYLNIGFGSAGLTDANMNSLLSLVSGGAGSYSHLQVSNSNTGMPALSAVGTSSVSLDLADTGGMGINLISNGVLALKALNAASTNTEFATVTGAASGSPVVIGASDGGTGAVSLELQPQGGAGMVISGANLDTQSNALVAEIPVNPTGNGVTLTALVILTGSGSMKGADSYPAGAAPTHGVIGVAVNTVLGAAGNIAEVAYSGVVVCTFDTGGVTFNHYVVPGAGGQCKDSTSALTSAPPTTQYIGVSLQGVTGHGPGTILLRFGN